MGEGDLGSSGKHDEITPVYRLSLSQVLSACTFLVLGASFILTVTRNSSTDLEGAVERSEAKLRDEYRRADEQLRAEIRNAEERSTNTAKEAEIRVTRQLGANEGRDSKRFEGIESQLMALAKGKR